MRTIFTFILLAICNIAFLQKSSCQENRNDNFFPIRGICMQAPHSQGGDKFIKFIDEEFIPRSINTLVLRIDFNYQFESHPELNDSAALSRDEIKRIVAVCKKNNITIIPHINLLGHQSFGSRLGNLLRVYPEFDETPLVKMPEKHVWPNEDGLYCKSYCPLHPDVHKIVFDLIDEICDVFEADIFHAGMDEVFYIGEKQCPRCSGKNKAELFDGEVRSIHDHLASKGRKMWIWGDRLIDGITTGIGQWEASFNNTSGAIDMIPKDITICDWHYERPDQTPAYFAIKGFNVISCPWDNPSLTIMQTQDMFRYYKYSTPEMKKRFQGMMQTVWGGSTEKFIDVFYGKQPDTPHYGRSTSSSQVESFKTLFTEIQHSTAK